MPTKINGSTGVDKIQDGSVSSAAKLGAGIVTPEKTQVSASPSMVRLNTANGYGSTNTMIRRFLNVVANQGEDITYSDSATLGASFTINTSGVYAISYDDNFTASGWLGASLNSSQLTTNISTMTAANILMAAYTPSAGGSSSASCVVHLPAGSVVRPHTSGQATGTTTNAVQFTITRVA